MMSCHSSSLNSSTGLRLLRPTAWTKMSGAPADGRGLVDCGAAAIGGPQVGDDSGDRSGERRRRGGELSSRARSTSRTVTSAPWAARLGRRRTSQSAGAGDQGAPSGDRQPVLFCCTRCVLALV